MNKPRKINHKSDFDFFLDIKVCAGMDESGNRIYTDLGFPDFDFEGLAYTSNKANSFRFAYSESGGCVNCFNDNGRIHVVCDRHRLSVGQLMVELRSNLPNGIYPDGHKLIVDPMPVGIELVHGRGDCPSDAEISLVLPYIKGEAMEWDKMTDEEKTELADHVSSAIGAGNFFDTLSPEAAREMVVGIWDAPNAGE